MRAAPTGRPPADSQPDNTLTCVDPGGRTWTEATPLAIGPGGPEVSGELLPKHLALAQQQPYARFVLRCRTRE